MEAPAAARLESLDALRGADMFWIVGGAEVFRRAAEATDWALLRWIAAQTHHVEWNGFTFWDLVFPLFLFLAGTSTTFSFARRRDQGAARAQLARHALRRGLTLVFLGVVYNGLFALDFETLRYASVLGRIGLAWMVAAWIALGCGVRGQVGWIAGLLLGYWILMTAVPVPGQGSSSLEPGRTLADWLDRTLLPGRLHRGVRDPEGILATLPAVATALCGMLAGHWLRRTGLSGERRAVGLVAAGAAALALGWLWGRILPLNKNLWSSSFVVWTAGWSALLLGVFYWLIDLRGWRAWSRPFVVLGTNPIAAYLLAAFVDFQGLAGVLLGSAVPRRLHPVLLTAAGLALEWALLAWMHRRRMFLRV